MLNSFKKNIKRRLVKPFWNFRGSFQYFGEKVYFPKNSIIFNRAIEEGIYEQENLKIIKAFIKPNSTVFDVGANIGLMAIPLLAADKSIKVVSVEASPNTLPYLQKTFSKHSNKKNWTIIDKAVSDKSGTISFNLASKANGAYESILNTKRTDFTNSVQIDCTTIDLIWNDLKKPLISFIKIDIEGADLLALKGASYCIKECKPVILMEWNQVNIKPFNLNNTDLLFFAQESNYSIYALPTMNKIACFTDMKLFGLLTENFLLVPNEEF